ALALFDWRFFPLCLVGGLPVLFCTLNHARHSQELSQKTHDQLEREVDILAAQSQEKINQHFELLARWRVTLSDRSAWVTLALEGTMLLVILLVISIVCTTGLRSVENLVAIFRYLTMLSMGLGNLPILIEQIARLHDIRERMV
ncbi:MAG: hypothetical protein KDA84_02385, partial [Planctomycetaceae bacterium]|nr:hypothetical protein [Planctomycetaceae bacterium]